MFKKFLKVTIVFGLLLASYAGYVKVFAIASAWVEKTHPRPPAITHKPSKHQIRAIELAKQTFGDRHWAADEKLSLRYYNVEHGYYMFAKKYVRQSEGKELVFTPFAVISQSRDGKKIQTATSDRATIILDKPMGLPGTGSSGSMKVIHAKMEGDVAIRDDKGNTKPADDLVIKMNYAEYDEKAMTIESESDLVLTDRNMRCTATGVQIDLREKDPETPGAQSAGFDGARMITLRKNVHIVIQDVGQSGGLPGSAKAKQKAGTKTPLDVRCDDELRIELPERPAWVKVGPPAPPAPTFANFLRNVHVLRGKVDESPDTLDCDELRLTLLPKGPAAAASKAEAGNDQDTSEPEGDESGDSGGPLSDLTIRRAVATGHAVWLESKSQESQARCGELIYDKLLPRQPDKIFLRAQPGQKLDFRKIERVQEGPDRGKIQTVTKIQSAMATIFDDGKSGGASTIIAEGAGELQMQPALDQPADRTATWQDKLQVETLESPVKDDRVHKKISLFGQPELIDHHRGARLDSRKEIIVWLQSKPQPKDTDKGKAAAPERAAGTGQSLAGGSFEIRQLEAWDDVHMKATNQELVARERLIAQFKTEPAPKVQPGAPAAEPPAQPPKEETKESKQEQDSKSLEPFTKADANRVWAEILQRQAQGADTQGSGGRQSQGVSEVQKVNMRGRVAFHQDPKPGKEHGTDAAGEAMYLQNLGSSRWKIDLADHDVDTPAQPGAENRPLAPATASSEGHTIAGPRISLNQLTDESRVVGPGMLTLITERDLLADKSATKETTEVPKVAGRADRGDVKAIKKKIPLKITWTKEMRFYGRRNDPQGRPVAVAEFVSVEEDPSGRPLPATQPDVVKAWTEDGLGLIQCRLMRIYMDKPISFKQAAKPANAAEDEAVEPEPQAEIASVQCFNDVTVISRKVDPDFRALVQMQRIQADELLTYDRATGDFHVSGPGIVYLFNREGESETAPNPGAPASGRPIVRPAANPSRGVARNGRRPGQPSDPKRKDKEPDPNPNHRRLTLTQVKFSDQMKGRFAMTKNDEESTDPRWAEFFGNVESLHGTPLRTSTPEPPKDPNVLPVPRERWFGLDADNLRPGDSFMTAQMMRVLSEPPLPGSPKGTPASNFVSAWREVNVRFDTATIAADRATYDSTKNLYYAYGDEGRRVQLVQQNGPGQESSFSSGSAIRYNHTTGEVEADKPGAFQMVDKVGARPNVPPKPKAPPPKRFRRLIPQNRGSTERKGMQGGK